MAITPSQWSHVLTLPESYTPSAATSGQTLVITEGVIAKLSTADQNTFWNAVQNGGGDVRICTDVAGTNQLPVEIVSLDNVAQTCVIWTRKATYAGTGELYVFIGKAGETQPAVTDPFGRNAVWSDYLLVWHGQDIAGAIVDSSGNQSNASVTGSVSNAAGAFGYGQSFAFDGSAGRVGLSGNLSGIQGNTETALTYQANVKLSSPPTTNQSIIGSTINDGSAIAASWMMADNDDTVSGQSDTFILAPNGRSERFGVGGNSANTSSHMLHGLWANGSAGGEALDGSEKYLDGTFVTSNPISEASGFVNLHANFEVGGSADFATSPINGVIDEVRFRIGLLSQSFIATEYANQSDPASFFGTPTISLTSGELEPVAQPVSLITAEIKNEALTLPISEALSVNLLTGEHVTNGYVLNLVSSQVGNATISEERHQASMLTVEQTASQSVISIAAEHLSEAQILTPIQHLRLNSIVAQQAEQAVSASLSSIQALTFVVAEEIQNAAPLTVEQYTGQLITLIVAEQQEGAQTSLVSQVNKLDLVTAEQASDAQALSIKDLQKIKTIEVEQLTEAEILHVLLSGDNTDLTGLRLQPVTPIYSITPIANSYSLNKV